MESHGQAQLIYKYRKYQLLMNRLESQIGSEPCDPPASVGLALLGLASPQSHPHAPGLPDPGKFDNTPTLFIFQTLFHHHRQA